MVFTDTPDAAFDFENFNGHHGSITYYLKRNHIYPHHLLTKYSLAIPLKCTTAVDIVDAFTNEFICVLWTESRERSKILTDQEINFINSLMRGVARKFRISFH